MHIYWLVHNLINYVLLNSFCSISFSRLLLILKCVFFQQLSKNSGPSLLTLFVDLLKSLLHKGKDTELRSQQELKKGQIESDLFMDEASLIATETKNNMVRFIFGTVFKCYPNCHSVDWSWVGGFYRILEGKQYL